MPSFSTTAPTDMASQLSPSSRGVSPNTRRLSPPNRRRGTASGHSEPEAHGHADHADDPTTLRPFCQRHPGEITSHPATAASSCLRT